MVAKVKPLTPAQRTVINELALTFVFTEIEKQIVVPMHEKSTGKKYNRKHPESFVNTMLSKNPKTKQIFTAFERAIRKERNRQIKLFEEDNNGN